MIFSLFLLNSLLCALALINFITIRKPMTLSPVESSILILLPVRNEEDNIARILGELENQRGLSQCKVLVIDDHSDDQTANIARSFISDRISVITAPELPKGWLGKVHALQSGFLASAPVDVVISIDADVQFAPDAIARAVRSLNESKLDFISPYPRQIALTLPERLTQPLLQWSWMSTLLLRGAEKFLMKSTVVCNGQFLVMKYQSLSTIGGFNSIAHKVLDDIELGRSFVASGFKGAVIDGSAIASTRMYKSFSEIKSGYGKSLHSAFGNIAGAIFAALFIFASGVLPFIFALSGNLLAIAASLAIVLTRVLSAAASGGRVRDSFLHPFSALLFIYLLYFSWRNKGKTQWKGRTL